MDTIYDGYKVYSDGQFPSFYSTWNKANSAAGMFYANTGKTVHVYGFIGETKRLIKTWHKPART